MYQGEYQKKLMTPDKAVEYIASGSTIVNAMASGEPPALLTALADRVRVENLHPLKVFFLIPMEHSARKILAPDLCIKMPPIPGLSAQRTGN
jgi:itaconate CoA-transferase